MNNKDITDVKQLLSETKKIVITTHTNPDGDAIGSSLALFGMLKLLKHQVSVIIPDEMPDFLKWMPYVETVIVNSLQPTLSADLFKQADIIFCLDFNSINRVAGLSSILKDSKAIKILMDHHLHPGHFCNYIFSVIGISSTSELLYGFFKQCAFENLINKEIATCLYVGIMTDTGCFSYSVNQAETYFTVSKLVQTNIDCLYIHNQVYSTFTSDRLRLLGFCLSDGLFILPEFNTAYIRLTKEEMNKYNFRTGDTEGIVNYPLSIKEIKFSAIFMERENYTKISFRSKGSFSTDEFARKHFNGGGHMNASGSNWEASLDETITKFKSALHNYQNELNEQLI